VAPLVPVIGGDARRRTLLVVLAGLAVVVAVGVVSLWPLRQPAVRVTQEEYDRIGNDVTTVAEIETLLGGPPGDYTTGPTDESSVSLGSGDRTVAWYTDDGHIIVQADADGHVEGVGFMPPKKASGVVNTLRWRAKRLWRILFP
jgi:hypothetical protein